MNLQPINPPLRKGQIVYCAVCKAGGATLADLDGDAFKAFYHPGCVPGTPTVYQALKAAGVPLDSHESDLYAKVTPESTRILQEYGLRAGALCSVFISQLDGQRWYDVPFKFDPWWEARAGKR